MLLRLQILSGIRAIRSYGRELNELGLLFKKKGFWGLFLKRCRGNMKL
jgi:hypothetical protein